MSHRQILAILFAVAVLSGSAVFITASLNAVHPESPEQLQTSQQTKTNAPSSENVAPSNNTPPIGEARASIEEVAVKAAEVYVKTGGDLEKTRSILATANSTDPVELEKARLAAQTILDRSKDAIVAAKAQVIGQSITIAPDPEEVAAIAASMYLENIDAEKTTAFLKNSLHSNDQVTLAKALAAAQAVVKKSGIFGVSFRIEGDTIVCDNSAAIKHEYQHQQTPAQISLTRQLCPSISKDPAVFARQEGPCTLAISAAGLLDDQGYNVDRVNKWLQKQLADESQRSHQPLPDNATLRIMQEGAQLRLNQGKHQKDVKTLIQGNTLVFDFVCKGQCG